MKTDLSHCQLHCLPEMAAPLSRTSKFWQLRNRLKRILKRRLNYFFNFFVRKSLSPLPAEALA
jgi:hypothetical protein